MVYTPNSAASPYLQPSDLIARVDVNLLCELVSDNGSSPVSPTELLTDTNLITALSDASGELESAIFASERYSPVDLQALTGVSQQYMIRILCDLAIYYLWTRRNTAPLPQTLQEKYDKATEALKSLSMGIRIFSFLEVQEAGVPVTQQMQLSQYYNNNLISARWHRMFGYRQSERRGPF